MEKYEIEKLRSLPIEEVAELLGLQVSRHKALCPFHADHHASLSFNTRKNTCRCFVCMDKSLDCIALVMKQMHVDFLVASHWLADRFGISLRGRKIDRAYSSRTTASGTRTAAGGTRTTAGGTRTTAQDESSSATTTVASPSFDASRYARFFEHPWLSDEARRFLFEERGLDERVVRWCQLSSWQDREGTHWLQIPYFDIEGRIIGMQNRNLDYRKSGTLDYGIVGTDSVGNNGSSERDSSGKDVSEGKNVSDGKAVSKEKNASDGKKAKPRFRFPYGAKCGIYNLPVIGRMKVGDELYITEGCSDCWAMLSSGHKAIAIPSATLLSLEDKRLLTELSSRLQIQWHMYPDKDAPGERLFLQLRQLLPSLQHHQLPPDCKDFAEAFLKGKKVKG